MSFLLDELIVWLFLFDIYINPCYYVIKEYNASKDTPFSIVEKNSVQSVTSFLKSRWQVRC